MDTGIYTPLVIQVVHMMVPLSVSMAMGIVTFLAVAIILRKRFKRKHAVFGGEVAAFFTFAACMWTGYVTPYGGKIGPAFNTLTSGSFAPTSGAFSAEPRCQWLNDEMKRLNASGIQGATTVAYALRQKAADTHCLAGARSAEVYPSMAYVEGYMFRVKDGDACQWARLEYLKLASRSNVALVLSDLQTQNRRVEQASCFRY